MKNLLKLMAALAIVLLAAPGFGQEMPDKIRKHIERVFIGDWVNVTEFDGKSSPAAFSWKWSNSKDVVICSWRGVDSTLQLVGYWDGEQKEFVIHGQSSKGDFWTTRYDELSDNKWTGHGTGRYEGKTWDSDVSIEWTDKDEGYVYRDTTDGKPFVTKGHRAKVVPNAEKALRKFGRFMVGTWTRTDDGVKREHKYNWGLDKKFVRSNARKDPNAWDGFFGVDLSNGKVGWWGFFANGTSGVVHMTKATDSEWVFEGQDFGPDGVFYRQVIAKKTGPNKLNAIVRDTINGEVTETNEDWEKQPAKKSRTLGGSEPNKQEPRLARLDVALSFLLFNRQRGN